MSRRKAQAALEFIMTYGWALLAILAAIGALAYFGFFSTRYAPERCSFPAGVDCMEFGIAKVGNNHNLTLILKNNLAEAITVQAINISTVTTQGTCTPQVFDMPSENRSQINCVFPLFTDKQAKFTGVIVYKKVLGDYNHTVRGDIVANVN